MSNELAIQAKNSPEMMPELWREVERLIAWHAKRYIARGDNMGSRLFDFDDLMQSGYLALVDAVRTFEPTAGMAFSTFLGYHLRRHFAEVAGCRGTKRRPEVYASSLDMPIGDDTDASRLDMLADTAAHLAYDDIIEDVASQQACAAILEEADKLPEQQRQAVTMHTYQGMTLKDTAAAMGVSPEAVRQHEYKGLRKLRNTKTVRMMGFRHVGLGRFKQTHTSTVEETILWMERRGYFRA